MCFHVNVFLVHIAGEYNMYILNKQRVELYLCFQSGPARCILG